MQAHRIAADAHRSRALGDKAGYERLHFVEPTLERLMFRLEILKLDPLNILLTVRREMEEIQQGRHNRVKKKKLDVHWLDDVPLTFVLLAAASAGCAWLAPGKTRDVIRSYTIKLIGYHRPIAFNFTPLAF
jgi:hypothetical protein